MKDVIKVINPISPSPVSILHFEDIRIFPDSNVSQNGQQSELL
jgi:hypothetical protein